jgi:hypothetical protein
MDSPVNPKLGMSDIIEGGHEIIAMQLKRSRGEPSEYPLLAPLKIHYDPLQLKNDFELIRNRFQNDYLEERKDILGTSLENAYRYLSDLGFLAETYSAHALHGPGSNNLHEFIPEGTKELLSQLAPICRIHYAIGQPGMDVKAHVDCHHYRLHGFRIHIPILNHATIIFNDGEKTQSFDLTPGHVWFVNNAVSHRVLNQTKGERVSILLQMMSDDVLFQYIDKATAVPFKIE